MTKLQNFLISKRALVILSFVLLAGVLIYQVLGPPFSMESNLASIEWDLTSVLLDDPAVFEHQVRSVLERRCVVCHGCYDTPCQLKLSSSEGLQRGASEELIYNPARISPMQPTRLFVDARSTTEWSHA